MYNTLATEFCHCKHLPPHLHFGCLFSLGCRKNERQEVALLPISCCCSCGAERRTGLTCFVRLQKERTTFNNPTSHKCAKSACECFHKQQSQVTSIKIVCFTTQIDSKQLYSCTADLEEKNITVQLK